jgi:3-hydroxybutyryl-CoA dehydratase
MSFAVGDAAEIRMTVTDEIVRNFGHLVGDLNPVHFDEQFAAGTRFKKRIAHGMIGASMISAVLGTKLPGPGTIYLSQTLKFAAPVYLGQTVIARVEIIAIRDDKPIITLKTTCTTDDGTIVLTGEAVTLFEV